MPYAFVIFLGDLGHRHFRFVFQNQRAGIVHLTPLVG